jgi:hypothetical protein
VKASSDREDLAGAEQLRPHRQAVRAGALAWRGAAGAANRLAARFELGVIVRRHPFHAVVLVVHRIAKDVVDGDVGRAGREALLRGKTIEQLIKELRTFSDQKAKVRISIDGGDILYPISILGNFNTTEGCTPGIAFFPDDELLIYMLKGRSPAVINTDRWPVMKPKARRRKAPKAKPS